MPGQQRVAGFLDILAKSPPPVVLLEGGTADERLALAMYYAAGLNCPEGSPPCGHCRVCRQVETGTYPDVILFDGREESIKIEPVREMRSILGQKPRGQGKRVVVFHEAQELTIPAGNALLKCMEEPGEDNVFVLLAPQRERLLPTLVSRSWTLTLAWPDSLETEPGEWSRALAAFLENGRGWFERTQTKGAVNRSTAFEAVISWQRDLARAMAGTGDLFSARLGPGGLRRFDLVLDMAQEALVCGVNPALVLDWAALRAFGLSRAE